MLLTIAIAGKEPSMFGRRDKEPSRLWRHGDVLIGQVAALPPGVQPQKHPILARGEVTGHSHRIADPTTAQLFELDGVLYLDVVAALATVIHEEHKPITLPRGTYRVWIQREYSPAEIRRVID
jgi:hypothetical protein